MYYLFLDESGDHGLTTVDDSFPVFLLFGVLTSHQEYTKIRDEINLIKNTFWNNKEVVLHSSDIRKCNKEFQILFDLNLKSKFYSALNKIITDSDYKFFASAINKREYINLFGKLSNDVYELALSFIIERAVFCLDDIFQQDKKLTIVIERRGKNEDRKLNTHFQKLLSRGTGYVNAERLKALDLKIEFRYKKQNVNGLQLADLIAYPIARYVIDKNRANPA